MPPPHPLRSESVSSRWHILVALAAYSGLAVLQTFPLIRFLSSRLPKDLGDPLLAASILWWNAHQTPLTARWWDGFGFFPAPGMMSFSEHFLGASLIASPLQWLGASPIAAYNVTLLLSYPLCGIAAYALAWRLTQRRDAAALCGLAYAFNPYRVAHVEHLELLMSFGMPAALWALHLYAERRERRWLVAFAAALAIQALSNSYYGLFFTVFLGLWLLWFMRVKEGRAIAAIGGAAASASLVVAPIVAGYIRFHGEHSVTRDFDEVLKYSGDLTSLVTAASLSSLWGWTSGLNGGERQLFPGLTVVAMIVGGVIWRPRLTGNAPGGWRTIAAGCWGMAALFAAAALWATLAGPTVWQQGWLRVSISTLHKPLTLSLLFTAAALLSTETFRRAWQRRSAFAFYIIAAVTLYVCSLGPRPTLLGQQVLYEPPYAWLMRLPFFDETVRVPARFAMLGMLALAVAASLAFDRLSHPRWRAVAFMIAGVGILADSWMRDLPLPPVSQQVFQIPAGDRSAAVIEVPLGDVWRDSAALYRATLHQARTVNGYNGFEPSYYQVLRRALEDRDPTILSALASAGPLLIAADKQADPEQSLRQFLARQDGVRRIADDVRWTLFRLPAQAPPPIEPHCEGAALAIVAAEDRSGPIDVSMLTDGNPQTRWITSAPQRANDEMILDLGHVDAICGLELSMGREAVLYPGALVVSVSPDRTQWSPAFRGHLGGAAFRAALDDPSSVRITLPIPATPVRFLRLQIEQSQREYPWAIADVVVTEATGN